LKLDDIEITRGIVRAYHRRLEDCLDSDVIIVGGGPAGLLAAGRLAGRGLRATVLEKRLAIGGGIWGGGMLMNVIAVQETVRPILDELAVVPQTTESALLVVDASELACALCLYAIRRGATVLTSTAMEDIRVVEGRVRGVVVNRPSVAHMRLPVDPITFGARVVIDGTGHEAGAVRMLQAHGLALDTPTGRMVGEGPMDAERGESFVVDHTGCVFPGLYVAGMAVCATFGGARMGPIFGGMLQSGAKVADRVAEELTGAGGPGTTTG